MYEFSSYHVLLSVLGASLMLAYWLPAALFRTVPGAPAIVIGLGFIFYQFIPDLPAPPNPVDSPLLWEKTSELVLIVVLFATGLRIDQIKGIRRWAPTIRLLAITMPVTIAAVALLGWLLAGMTLAGAVILGAPLAPTDPVLAGDVQVGPPSQGNEPPVRLSLTGEAGLNDGLAFPFVYLGIGLATVGAQDPAWLANWLAIDVLYRVSVGAVGGVAFGYGFGRLSFATTRLARLADSSPGVIALAGTLLCYGLVELIEGYGFLAVFAAGICYRRVEQEHSVHHRMHRFSESIEQALTALLLFSLGSVLPGLWPSLNWTHSVIGFGLLLFIRPMAGMLGLLGSALPRRQRWAVSFLGVRGIGSLYYMGYASGKIEFINNNELWALIGFTIFASTVIHGATAGWILRRVTPQPD